jgi:hypothetical protein
MRSRFSHGGWQGAPATSICLRHLIPNIAPLIATQATANRSHSRTLQPECRSVSYSPRHEPG